MTVALAGTQETTADAGCCSETLEQHRSFGPLIEDLLVRVMRLPDEKEPWVADLRPRIRHLATVLHAHFTDEEQSSLFIDIPVQCPHHAEKLDRLKAEHATLVERLRTALDDADTADIDVLAARVQRAMAQVRRHEAEETEIILEAFWGDVGTSE